MKKKLETSVVTHIGIDLSKNILQVHCADSESRKVMSRGIARGSVLAYTANLQPCTIAMEACGSSHYWGREFTKQGHSVKLIPAQYVKPFVKTHKNDRIDAEAIYEASLRPNMKTVPVKTIEQHDLQSLHRVRDIVRKNRTALSNQLRGLLGEFGIVIPQGLRHVFDRMPSILIDEKCQLSDIMGQLLREQFEELVRVDQRYAELTERLATIAREHPVCRRLLKIPGIGPLSATALYAAVGDAKQFRRGRDMSAWLGVVPRQHSTGGRSRLGRIIKHGNGYLRALLTGGARSAVQYAGTKSDRTSQWLNRIKHQKGYNIAVIAAVNKTLRVAWAVLAREEEYDSGKQEELARQYSNKVA